MRNREWLLNKMQSMSDEEFNEILNLDCAEWEPSYKKCATLKCKKCCLNWLKSEHKEKIILSEAERVILENIHKDYKWISRDRDEKLYIYTVKPSRSTLFNNWNLIEGKAGSMSTFNHLFQFITWQDEEPYNIEELLKN